MKIYSVCSRSIWKIYSVCSRSTWRYTVYVVDLPLGTRKMATVFHVMITMDHGTTGLNVDICHLWASSLVWALPFSCSIERTIAISYMNCVNCVDLKQNHPKALRNTKVVSFVRDLQTLRWPLTVIAFVPFLHLGLSHSSINSNSLMSSVDLK